MRSEMPRCGFSLALGVSALLTLAAGTAFEVACGKTLDVTDAGACDPNATPVDCYTGPPGTAGKGNCRAGTHHCTDGHLTCENEITPQPELCNNEDDDCNGLIDDLFADAMILGHCDSPACIGDAAGVPYTCWGPDPGICGVGTFSCHYIAEPEKCAELVHVGAPEICNGVDDDCNGLIDDGLDNEAACNLGDGATWAADANPFEAGADGGLITHVLGECVHGRLACVDIQCDVHGCAEAGDWCFPSLPTPEVCDGLDNDCNGLIDDNCDAGK